ncbi:hypothetical protein GIB67_008641 [Kingdonia uniflora]|uniref:Aminotransferase-like plant mobile domain-containing protein n=1 Tax=Kingdonia uniflora TaxID=39325 RepID=A0A7J7M534_9MAGN|nr:hypothetical protein GIB67_008641 [Kingdonia uniflora]
MSVPHAYMLYILGFFLFPTKKGTDVSVRYLDPFVKDKVAKKYLWGSAVLAHMYYNLGAASRDDGRQFACCTTLLESWIFAHFPKLVGISKEMDSDACEHCTCWKWDVSITDRYGGTSLLKFRVVLDNYKLDDHHEHASLSPNAHDAMPTRGGSGGFDQQITVLNDQLQKLKEDKEKESEANINLRDSLKEKTSECILLKKTIEQMNEDIQLKRVLDEQCALAFADLPGQLDVKILEYKNLEEKKYKFGGRAKCKESELLNAVNALLMEQIDLHHPPATPLAVLQSHQPMPYATLAKKYDDLLSAHEDVKKKLIAKEDFRKKLVNADERMKSLEVNNIEWEVWRQALKKALASEGMGDMGDPTFEELFEQNERFFTIE